jgi:hypothetical protein
MADSLTGEMDPMDDYPKKLVAYLNTLEPEQRTLRERLYRTTLAQALEHNLQSPRFWAARQIIAGLTTGQIQHKILKRIRRVSRLDDSAPVNETPRNAKASPVRRLRETQAHS